MGKIICIANQKGGVGKTTTAINLGASLAAAEQNVLIVDIDPQGNATSGFGIDKDSLDKTIYHVIIDQANLAEIIKETELPYLKIAPSNPDLFGAEIELVHAKEREYRLKRALESVVDQYQFIFIDCPPSLGLLTINSLTAAHSILVPIQCEYYAMEGLGQLLTTIKLIRRSLNPDLQIEGFLLTMFDTRVNLSHQVENEIKNHFGAKVFKTIIPRNVRLSESPSYGKPVLLYDVNSSGAKSYLDLATEFLNYCSL